MSEKNLLIEDETNLVWQGNKSAINLQQAMCEDMFPLIREIPRVSCKKGQKSLDLSSPIVYNNDRSDQ